MKTINTSKISGTEELLPDNQAIFNDLKAKILHTYRQHGYLNIEPPILQRIEVLLAKAGGDTEKQIYKVIKTAESAENTDQALRFDHTVPLARYIVEHKNNLSFPLKVSNIGLNFRGERAQKGRFREFYQCDIDIIGRSQLPIAYDADVISTLLDTLKSFELSTPILARINNRKILSSLLESLDLQASSKDIYNIIDHAEKVTPEQTKVSFSKINLNNDQITKLLAFINLHGDRSFVIKNLGNLNIDNALFNEGVTELDQVLYLLESMGLSDQIIADMKIVRGLDYYTGTVFEFVMPEYQHIGSICGGGRYENLTHFFSDQSFPGVGGSIGLTRLFHVLSEHHLLKTTPDHSLIDYAIIPISDNEYEYAFQVAANLRDNGNSVTTVMTNKKLRDKMTYAAKIAQKAIVIGEEEVNSKLLKAKNFITGQAEELQIASHPVATANPEDFWGTE